MLRTTPSKVPTSITGRTPLRRTAAITAEKSIVPSPTAACASVVPSLSWRWKWSDGHLEKCGQDVILVRVPDIEREPSAVDQRQLVRGLEKEVLPVAHVLDEERGREILRGPEEVRERLPELLLGPLPVAGPGEVSRVDHDRGPDLRGSARHATVTSTLARRTGSSRLARFTPRDGAWTMYRRSKVSSTAVSSRRWQPSSMISTLSVSAESRSSAISSGMSFRQKDEMANPVRMNVSSLMNGWRGGYLWNGLGQRRANARAASTNAEQKRSEKYAWV